MDTHTDTFLLNGDTIWYADMRARPSTHLPLSPFLQMAAAALSSPEAVCGNRFVAVNFKSDRRNGAHGGAGANHHGAHARYLRVSHSTSRHRIRM